MTKWVTLYWQAVEDIDTGNFRCLRIEACKIEQVIKKTIWYSIKWLSQHYNGRYCLNGIAGKKGESNIPYIIFILLLPFASDLILRQYATHIILVLYKI